MSDPSAELAANAVRSPDDAVRVRAEIEEYLDARAQDGAGRVAALRDLAARADRSLPVLYKLREQRHVGAESVAAVSRALAGWRLARGPHEGGLTAAEIAGADVLAMHKGELGWFAAPSDIDAWVWRARRGRQAAYAWAVRLTDQGCAAAARALMEDGRVHLVQRRLRGGRYLHLMEKR